MSMKILDVSTCIVEIEQTFVDSTRYRSSVFLQGDGRLKCLSSRCKSRNHFKCEHVKFVQSQKVQFVPETPLTQTDIESLIEED